MITVAVLGEKGVEYDIDKFFYLGSPFSVHHSVFVSRKEAGLSSIEKLRAAPGIRIGGQSVGFSIYNEGRLFAYVVGLKEPKFVTGYGGAELDPALMRGEIDARVTTAGTVLQRNPEWMSGGAVDFHAVLEVPKGDKHPRFASLPEIESFAKSEKVRKVIAMQRAFRLTGQTSLLPPGTPKDRVAILQEAFRKAYQDPEFHKEYKKLTTDDATPLMPDSQEKTIREIPRDRETAEIFKKLVGAGPLPPGWVLVGNKKTKKEDRTMPIVTIFGGTFGDDEELARNVATKLGYQFVSREIFVAASRRCDVPEAKLSDIVEKEPHWWERWHENLQPYRTALQSAMSEAALAENLVYLGHVGHGLLPGIRHVLRVLLTAPMEYRVEQVSKRQGLDPKAARRYIDHVEKARTRRLMALFGSDWCDPGQYALILNMAQMSSAAAENIIAHAVHLMDYQATAESRQALGDLALTARVQAHLLTDPRLRDVNISVQAKQGDVTLAGLLPQSVSEYEVRRIVDGIPGVKNVMSDFVSIGRVLRSASGR